MENKPKTPPFATFIIILVVFTAFYALFGGNGGDNARTNEESERTEVSVPVPARVEQPKTNILVVLIEPIKIPTTKNEVSVVYQIYATSVEIGINSSTVKIVPSHPSFGSAIVLTMDSVSFIQYK